MEAASLKKINLEELQKPKTLILIHYKNKRISIPLFDIQPNITQYLYHQIEKFQHTVLQPQQEALSLKSKSKHSPANIICFSSRQQENHRIDLKMNILLSMMRLSHDCGKCRSDVRTIDITFFYKYMEIQPYYSPSHKQLIPQYQLYTILSSDKIFTVYLGRRIHDGRYFSIQVGSTQNKFAEREYNILKQMHQEQYHQQRSDLGAIPEIQEVRNSEGLIICVLEFCPGGSLLQSPKKASEMQCLQFMKQLIWGVHTLHQRYNILHRNITLDSIFLDFHGNIRIYNYKNCQLCFSSNYLLNSQIPKVYETQYELEDGTTPPQVRRSGNYNRLVDYYGVGVVLYQIYNGKKPNLETKNENIKEREGIQIAIENLMSENLRDRQAFTNQIISELVEEKKQLYSVRQSMQENQDYLLSLNKMKVGHNFSIDEKGQNNIGHEDVAKLLKPGNDDQLYYLHPVGKHSKSKNKKKSKSKDKDKDKKSQDNSGIFKKSFDTKSRKSNDSKVSQQKSLNKSLERSKKSKNKSISSKKHSDKSKTKKQTVHNKPPSTKMLNNVKSPPRSRAVKSPEKLIKPKEQKCLDYNSYFKKNNK